LNAIARFNQQPHDCSSQGGCNAHLLVGECFNLPGCPNAQRQTLPFDWLHPNAQAIACGFIDLDCFWSSRSTPRFKLFIPMTGMC
jgi:hypothetical protein